MIFEAGFVQRQKTTGFGAGRASSVGGLLVRQSNGDLCRPAPKCDSAEVTQRSFRFNVCPDDNLVGGNRSKAHLT